MSMNLRKLETQGGKKRKRGKAKHGVYAYLASGKLPSGRSWKKTQAQVLKLREDLIKQYGGDKIRPTVLALIESAIEGLTIQRLAGLYVKKAGILRVDSLGRGNRELHSILSGQFISYANLVRLNLEAAARLAALSTKDDDQDLASIDAEYRDKPQDSPADGSGSEAGGQTGAAEGKGAEGTLIRIDQKIKAKETNHEGFEAGVYARRQG